MVALSTNRTERMAPGSVLASDRGPLEVAAAAPAPGGGGVARWVVTFVAVNDHKSAEALRGVVLRAEPLNDPEVLWVHDLIGSRVHDTDGTDRGTVTDVQANPASDLLVLDSGALVPLCFVVEHGPGTLTVDVPAGLFDDG